jgi:capsular polysaccharide biosynthesis protein
MIAAGSPLAPRYGFPGLHDLAEDHDFALRRVRGPQLLPRAPLQCARVLPGSFGFWTHTAFPQPQAEYQAWAYGLRRFGHVLTSGRSGGLVTPDGGYEPEVSQHAIGWTDEAHLRLRNGAVELGAAPSVRIDEPILIAFNGGYRNYAHWMSEQIAAIWAALYTPAGEGLLIGLPKQMPAYAEATLALLDPPPERIRRLPDAVLELTNGWFPTPFTFAAMPLTVQDAADALAARVASDPNARRMIYLSRRDAPARPLLNERALEAALAAIGFEIVIGAALSLPEQIKLFREAALVIGPHGAGLANIAFARPGATLLELSPEYATQPHFWTSASLAGVDYGYAQGTSFTYDNAVQEAGGNWEAPWVIEIDMVLELARRLRDRALAADMSGQRAPRP